MGYNRLSGRGRFANTNTNLALRGDVVKYRDMGNIPIKYERRITALYQTRISASTPGGQPSERGAPGAEPARGSSEVSPPGSAHRHRAQAPRGRSWSRSWSRSRRLPPGRQREVLLVRMWGGGFSSFASRSFVLGDIAAPRELRAPGSLNVAECLGGQWRRTRLSPASRPTKALKGVRGAPGGGQLAARNRSRVKTEMP